MIVDGRPALARPRGTLVAVVAVVALLAMSNLMSNRLLPASLYVPWNLTVTLLLAIVATRVGGCSREDLGVTRDAARRGARWGLALGAGVAAVYLVSALVSRDLFRDERVLGSGGVMLVYQALVRIPLGTVVLEEFAFRGVLIAVIARLAGPVRAVLVSSALFGLWHILPALGLSDVNPVVAGAVEGGHARLVTVVAAVVATAAAGVVLSVVRLRSRSLLAPALVHVSTNSVGYLVAWLVLHLG